MCVMYIQESMKIGRYLALFRPERMKKIYNEGYEDEEDQRIRMWETNLLSEGPRVGFSGTQVRSGKEILYAYTEFT